MRRSRWLRRIAALKRAAEFRERLLKMRAQDAKSRPYIAEEIAALVWAVEELGKHIPSSEDSIVDHAESEAV